METITRLPIGTLVFWFIMYVVIHVGIGLYVKRMEKELKEKPGNVEIEKTVKIAKLCFKWFPAVVVIIALIAFYY